MKKMMTLIFLLAGLLVSVAAQAAETAYINLQLIVAESSVGKQAREEFNKSKEKMESTIKEKTKEIEAINADLQKEQKNNPVNEKRVASIIEKMQLKNKEYERFVADRKDELTKKDQDLVRQIMGKVTPILTELATTKGYTMIFKNGAELAYVAPDADITGEVLKRLNQL